MLCEWMCIGTHRPRQSVTHCLPALFECDEPLQLDLEDSRKREKEAAKDKVEEKAGGLSFCRVADLNRWRPSCLKIA